MAQDQTPVSTLRGIGDPVLNLARGTPSAAASYTTPRTQQGRTVRQRYSGSIARRAGRNPTNVPEFSMTPLALQLSSWLAASPEKNENEDNMQLENPAQAIISPTRSTPLNTANIGTRLSEISSPAKSTFFDDEMLVRDQ